MLLKDWGRLGTLLLQKTSLELVRSGDLCRNFPGMETKNNMEGEI